MALVYSRTTTLPFVEHQTWWNILGQWGFCPHLNLANTNKHYFNQGRQITPKTQTCPTRLENIPPGQFIGTFPKVTKGLQFLEMKID